MDEFLYYGEITKVDPLAHTVSGIVTSEKLDSQGDVLLHSGSKKALADWNVWGNIRAMHQPHVAGVRDMLVCDDAKKEHSVTIKVLDPVDWIKVENKAYNGFSVGGRVTRTRLPDGDAPEGTKRIVEEWECSEISLVDRPANPDARITIFKRDENRVESLTPEQVTELAVAARQNENIAKITANDIVLADGSATLATLPPGPVVPFPKVDLEKKGARVSADAVSRLHKLRDAALDMHRGAMDMCKCSDCTSKMEYGVIAAAQGSVPLSHTEGEPAHPSPLEAIGDRGQEDTEVPDETQDDQGEGITAYHTGGDGDTPSDDDTPGYSKADKTIARLVNPDTVEKMLAEFRTGLLAEVQALVKGSDQPKVEPKKIEKVNPPKAPSNDDAVLREIASLGELVKQGLESQAKVAGELEARIKAIESQPAPSVAAPVARLGASEKRLGVGINAPAAGGNDAVTLKVYEEMLADTSDARTKENIRDRIAMLKMRFGG